jgi:hypothetical protein
MARDEENRATHGDGWSGVARYGMNKHARLNVWIPVAICEGWLVCSNTQSCRLAAAYSSARPGFSPEPEQGLKARGWTAISAPQSLQ